MDLDLLVTLVDKFGFRAVPIIMVVLLYQLNRRTGKLSTKLDDNTAEIAKINTTVTLILEHERFVRPIMREESSAPHVAPNGGEPKVIIEDDITPIVQAPPKKKR